MRAVLGAQAAAAGSANQIRPDSVRALQRGVGNAAVVRALAWARDPSARHIGSIDHIAIETDETRVAPSVGGVEPRPTLEPTARPVLARCPCGGHAPTGGTCSSCAARGREDEEFELHTAALRRAVAARHALALRSGAGNRGVGAVLARARRELPAGPTPTVGSSGSGATSAQTCGPDVTQQVKDVIAATRATFNGWSERDQEIACGALESMDCAGVAWDIVELHNRGWLGAFTGCAQNPGPCQDTVRVDGSCSYGGSVNYVIFGVMCDLCDIWQSTMEDMIWAYKGDTRHWYVPASRRHAASANYGPSLEWARAGFHGWPTGATSPVGDRPACTDSCPATLSTGSTFNVHWVPSAETETTTDACDAWVTQARTLWSPRIID